MMIFPFIMTMMTLTVTMTGKIAGPYVYYFSGRIKTMIVADIAGSGFGDTFSNFRTEFGRCDDFDMASISED